MPSGRSKRRNWREWRKRKNRWEGSKSQTQTVRCLLLRCRLVSFRRRWRLPRSGSWRRRRSKKPKSSMREDWPGWWDTSWTQDNAKMNEWVKEQAYKLKLLKLPIIFLHEMRLHAFFFFLTAEGTILRSTRSVGNVTLFHFGTFGAPLRGLSTCRSHSPFFRNITLLPCCVEGRGETEENEARAATPGSGPSPLRQTGATSPRPGAMEMPHRAQAGQWRGTCPPPPPQPPLFLFFLIGSSLTTFYFNFKALRRISDLQVPIR